MSRRPDEEEPDDQDDPPDNGGPGGKRERMERVSISIRFDLALYRELRRLGEEQHRSFNGTVNEACKRYVRAMKPRLSRGDNGDTH
jgi:hypothetical protein